MTKQRSLIITFLTVFYAAGILTGYFITPEKPQYIPQTLPQNVSAPAASAVLSQEPSSRYLVKLENEVINIYRDENETLSLILTIDYINTYSVPQNQIEILKRGKYFETREDAAEFIQDLDS